MSHRTAVVLLLSLLPSVMPAQEPVQLEPVRGVGKCSMDSAASRRSGILTVWLAPSTTMADTSARAIIERSLVAEMQEAFRAPASVDLWPWPGTSGEHGFGISSFGGDLKVTVRDGIVTSREWILQPRGPFAGPVDDAALRAGSSAAFRQAAAATSTRNAVLMLKVKVSTTDSTFGVPLFRKRIGYLELSDPAQRLTGPAPQYPRSLARTNGHADFEFVINQFGKVDPRSIWVIEYTDAAFAASGRKAIEAATYRPAAVMKCAAGQMVMQRVSFESR